jgi:hypothetical protein
MRKTLPLAALLLAAGLAWGQPKVSGGGTPPPDDQAAREKAAAEQSRREAARKALGALKGGDAKGRGGQRDDRKPRGR